MTFYIDLGSEDEEILRRHAARLGRSLDSIVSEALETLIEEYEAADQIKSDQTNRT